MYARQHDFGTAGLRYAPRLLYGLVHRTRDGLPSHEGDYAVCAVVRAAVLHLEEGARVQPRPVERERVPAFVGHDFFVDFMEARRAREPFRDEARQRIFAPVAYRYVEAELLRVARRHFLRAAPAGGDYRVRVLAPRAADELAAFAVGDRGYSSAAAIASPSYWFVRQPCIWIENFLSERILVMSLINARRPVVDGAARPVRIFSRRLRARHISRIFPIALKSSRIGPASSFWRSANIFSYRAAFFASGSKRPRKVIHSRIVSRMSEMSPTA